MRPEIFLTLIDAARDPDVTHPCMRGITRVLGTRIKQYLVYYCTEADPENPPRTVYEPPPLSRDDWDILIGSCMATLSFTKRKDILYREIFRYRDIFQRWSTR